MADVDRMGGKGKGKKTATKGRKKAVVPEIGSDSKVATFLFEKMKPEIYKFREMTKDLNATVKDASQEIASLETRVGTLVENKIKSMIESVMIPMVEGKLFQMKEDIIQGIETILKNQQQDPVFNSNSQPPFVPDMNNYDYTFNDNENVSSLNRHIQII